MRVGGAGQPGVRGWPGASVQVAVRQESMPAEADSEILEFAISRELEAYNFYKALADRVAGEHMRRIFEDLAEEELEHKAKLELEILKLGRTLPEPGKLEPPAHEYIVSDSDAALEMDYRDMLLLGMEKEEASFRTYVGLIPQTTDESSREVLLALAEEEVRHKLRFEKEYQSLQRHK